MKRFDNINVIPFIDIMLVLLAIVLTTASFIAQGKLDITLPTASSQGEPPKGPPVNLAIDAQKRFHYNGESVGLAELKGRLEELSIVTRENRG